MSIKGKAYVMGAFEHPTRDAPDTSTPQLHAECAIGALQDAGLSADDVDAYFCAGDAPGFGGLSMIDYMGLKNVRHLDSTETGGSSYIVHVGHAAQAIAAEREGAAWIVAGQSAEGESHAGNGVRPESFVAEVSRCTALPVIAIGGVKPEDVAPLRRAGAWGVAVIRGIWGAADAGSAASDYLSRHDAVGAS